MDKMEVENICRDENRQILNSIVDMEKQKHEFNMEDQMTKGKMLNNADKSELFRIDQLVEQLQSGAFCHDMDHPYYERYRENETRRLLRIKVAQNRVSLSRERILREYEDLARTCILEFRDEFNRIEGKDAAADGIKSVNTSVVVASEREITLLSKSEKKNAMKKKKSLKRNRGKRLSSSIQSRSPPLLIQSPLPPIQKIYDFYDFKREEQDISNDISCIIKI